MIEFIRILNLTLAIVVVALVLFVMVVKFNKKRRHKRKENLINHIENELNDFLMMAEESLDSEINFASNPQFAVIAAQLKNRIDRKDFTKHLIELKQNLFGEYDELISKLYFELGLQNDSISKIKSKKIPEKIHGMHELSKFRVTDGQHYILPQITHTNQLIRQEAQVALVMLSETAPLAFLEYEWHDLDDWHKLCLHYVLDQSNLKYTIQYHKWLVHQEASVVIFAIQLAVIFKHIESVNQIRLLLDHENEQIKTNAIKAVAQMGDDQDSATIIKILNTTNEKSIQLACIEALAQIGSQEDLLPLLHLIDPNQVEITLKIFNTIEEITGDVEAYLLSIASFEMTGEIIPMINHVKNKLG